MSESGSSSQRLHLNLGGQRQLVHLISDGRHKPAILVLHGGPGLPNRQQFAAVHGPWRSLAEHATLLLWDQRGTGGSFAGTDWKRLTLDRLIEDARAVAEWAHERLAVERLFVLGFSWGTELGVRLVQRYPALFSGYIGSGQAVDGSRGETLSYEYVWQQAERAHANGDLRALTRIGAPTGGQYPSGVAGMIRQRAMLAKYPAPEVHQVVKRGFWASNVQAYTGAPYSLRDTWGVLRGHRKTLNQLWPAITDYDFTRDASRLHVPVCLLQGRHDHTTPSVLVEEWFQVLDAPEKKLRWFEHSSHGVAASEAPAFLSELTAFLTDYS